MEYAREKGISKKYASSGWAAFERPFALWAEGQGIALDYRAIELAPDALAARMAELHAEGLAGANVTLPLKELAARECVALAEAARLSGAVMAPGGIALVNQRFARC